MVLKQLKEKIMYVCRFCGKKFKKITHTHLKKEHNIGSIDDYEEIVIAKYGKDALLSEDELNEKLKEVTAKKFDGSSLNDVLMQSLTQGK